MTAGPSPGTITTVRGRREENTAAGLRQQLGGLRALLVISLLMTESVDEDQILQLAPSSARGLGAWRIEGYFFSDGQWRPGAGPAAAMPEGLAAQVASLGSGAGRVELAGRGWAAAFPLRSVSGLLGHL